MKTDLLNKWINRGFRTNILFRMHSACVDSYLLDTVGENQHKLTQSQPSKCPKQIKMVRDTIPT